MKKYLICTALACVAFTNNAMAQQEDDTDKYYIRNSVYMMKLTEKAPNKEYEQAYKIMNATFDTINFARRYERYNDFSLKTRVLDLDKLPAGTAAEGNALGEKSNKQAAYVARLNKYFKQDKTAAKLVAKWYSKPETPEGKVDLDFDLINIQEYGMKGLSEEIKSTVKESGGMVTAYAKNTSDKLLKNTYVCVNRYSYVDAKDIIEAAGAVADIALQKNEGLRLLSGLATSFAAKKIKGYFVVAHAYLFQLDWNAKAREKAENPEIWDNASLQAKLIDDPVFKLKYVGHSSKRAPAAMSLKASTTLQKLIGRGTVRATDRSFAALQRDHEDFRPMTSLHVRDGKLCAYIGMKEDIEAGDKFDVFEAVMSKDDPNQMEWKKIGTIKVGKTVWDNREGAGEVISGAAEEKDDQKAASTPYTEFKEKPGKFGEGHMIRLTK